jgi:hypothetical protein
MVFSAGMAIGSVIWGFIAEHASTPISLAAAAGGLLVTLPLTSRLHVLRGELPDFTPFGSKPLVPRLAIEPEMTDGPVRIMVDFDIHPDDYNDFVHAIHKLRSIRLRDGAMRWGVFQDADDPYRLTETFIMESWIDYLRQLERFTTADRVIHDRVFSFHAGPEQPRITHTIYAKERTNGNSGNS